MGRTTKKQSKNQVWTKKKKTSLSDQLHIVVFQVPRFFIRDIGQDNVEKVRIFFYSYCGDVPKVVLLKKKQMPESQKQKQKRLYPKYCYPQRVPASSCHLQKPRNC
uniref:Uncharacterized protein n=1 Tax=Ditylenchus dipsaci TaxID=166011 RepID=A0A915E6T7_9BILA